MGELGDLGCRLESLPAAPQKLSVFKIWSRAGRRSYGTRLQGGRVITYK